jgi:hypothetical protein
VKDSFLKRFFSNWEFVLKISVLSTMGGLLFSIILGSVFHLNFEIVYGVVSCVVVTGILGGAMTHVQDTIVDHMKNKHIIEVKPYPPSKKAPGI